MGFFKVLKRRKILFLNIFLLLYVSITLFAGERGLISYYEKKSLLENLDKKQIILSQKVKEIENKNNLLSSDLNFDFIDTLFREKLKFGNKNEILIKLNE